MRRFYERQRSATYPLSAQLESNFSPTSFQLNPTLCGSLPRGWDHPSSKVASRIPPGPARGHGAGRVGLAHAQSKDRMHPGAGHRFS